MFGAIAVLALFLIWISGYIYFRPTHEPLPQPKTPKPTYSPFRSAWIPEEDPEHEEDCLDDDAIIPPPMSPLSLPALPPLPKELVSPEKHPSGTATWVLKKVIEINLQRSLNLPQGQSGKDIRDLWNKTVAQCSSYGRSQVNIHDLTPAEVEIFDSLARQMRLRVLSKSERSISIHIGDQI